MFCSSLVPTPFFCDELSTPPLDKNWELFLTKGGLATLSPRGALLGARAC
jgi:hypothetical protein